MKLLKYIQKRLEIRRLLSKKCDWYREYEQRALTNWFNKYIKG